MMVLDQSAGASDRGRRFSVIGHSPLRRQEGSHAFHRQAMSHHRRYRRMLASISS
jgi:hypothetical protein